ncbi:nucleoside hydrolase [Amylibacter kogurei]|uniref:Nucleoside hydrolase n=1 Tax=Paramylibacter kogurei TaxID=1889778 RepID=A0A2G5K409_9RHOB|nr:nucleoside hydrolase [Amylibacter kogurei]PIB23464.1 nucleoside hydrolase [Amylibacter kogurei]
MTKQKILIDTDPGVDDAMAIFFACLHPDLDLVGMTGVFGNVTVDIAARNAIVLAERAGQDIPVARGADVPLKQTPNPVSDYVHGEQGFGDIPAQPTRAEILDESAAEFICRMINENPGEISLCPIGPLTNIALALEHDPSIAQKVKNVVIMGGSLREGGNVTPHAEANIWNDPHAADAVFAADWPVVMVGLDVTHRVVCTPEDFSELAKAAPKLGGFLQDASHFYIRFYEEVVGITGCYLHDPAAVIATLRPELFTIENHPIEVKVDGEEIGQTAISTNPDRRAMQICTGIQAEVVKDLFMDTIKSGF